MLRVEGQVLALAVINYPSKHIGEPASIVHPVFRTWHVSGEGKRIRVVSDETHVAAWVTSSLLTPQLVGKALSQGKQLVSSTGSKKL
jgi:hypothetical protein